MTDNEITREIIGAAIEVQKQLAPGLLESAYEECLAHELQVRNLSVERQKPVRWSINKLNSNVVIELTSLSRVGSWWN